MDSMYIHTLSMICTKDHQDFQAFLSNYSVIGWAALYVDGTAKFELVNIKINLIDYQTIFNVKLLLFEQ